MSTVSSSMECSICLVKSDLMAIAILINCGHYNWLQSISGAGQILLQNTDLVFAAIQSDGVWWYRMQKDYRIKSDTGLPQDCENLKEGIKNTDVFEQLSIYFDERTIEHIQLQMLLDTIQKAPLTPETKRALEVELGAEFRFALGSRLTNVLNEGLNNRIEDIIMKSLRSEHKRINIINKGVVLETEEPVHCSAVANVLKDRTKWQTSVDNPDTFVLQVSPGLTGYVKLLSAGENTTDILGNEHRLVELMNKNQVEFYCGTGSKENVYRLKNADILGCMTVSPHIKIGLK